MIDYKRNNKAITLITLVILIIVMIIIAGVTIRLTVGSDGLISRTLKESNNYKKQAEKEIIHISHQQAITSIEGNESITVAELISNCIKENGEPNLVLKKEDEENKYIIKFEKSNNVWQLNFSNGKVEFIGDGQSLGGNMELTKQDIIFTQNPDSWTKGSVTSSIAIKEELNNQYLTLEYSRNGTSWIKYVEELVSDENETIYVRVKHIITGETLYGGTENIGNIDKEAPTGEIVVSKTKSNSLEITVNAEDNLSGIKGYRYSIDGGASYTEQTTNNTQTFNDLNQNSNYSIYVKVEDNALNEATINKTGTTGAVQGLTAQDITFTLTPNTWTNGNVTVKAVPKISIEGYTLKTSKDGQNWSTSDTQTFSANGSMYVVLFDGRNYGASATQQVSIIDKTAPTISNVSFSNQPFYDTITFKASDSASKVTHYAITRNTTEPTQWSPVNTVNLDGVQVKQQYGATWARVFWHNNDFGTQLFTSDSEVLSANSTYKYSILGRIEQFRNSSNKFEFLLQYPYNEDKYNRWIQSDNPTTVTIPDGNGTEYANGYQAVHIDMSTLYWGGLTKSTTSATYIDGSVGHNNWYYAIGCKSKWDIGIPGSDSPGITSTVELWARIDNLPTTSVAEKTITLNIVSGAGDYYVWAKDAAGNKTYYKVTATNSYYRDIKLVSKYSAIWKKVFYHNCKSGTVLFTSDNEALSCNTLNKYSVLNRLANMKTGSKFEFLLEYPNQTTTQYNRWKQTNNPTTETIANGTGNEKAAGYEAVHVDWTGNYWGGLTKSTSNNVTFIDGSVGHGNWFYAIGAKAKHADGIPSYSSTPGAAVLYMRVK